MTLHLWDECSERSGGESDGGAFGNLMVQTQKSHCQVLLVDLSEGDQIMRLTMSSVMYMLRAPALW